MTTLSEECSTILQNNLPRILKDPDSFKIPYVIGDSIEESALADLGASIYVISYKIFMKLGLGEQTPTKNF